MRAKYLAEMLKDIDYDAMEKNDISFDRIVGDYIFRKVQSGNFNVFYLNTLDLRQD